VVFPLVSFPTARQPGFQVPFLSSCPILLLVNACLLCFFFFFPLPSGLRAESSLLQITNFSVLISKLLRVPSANQIQNIAILLSVTSGVDKNLSLLFISYLMVIQFGHFCVCPLDITSKVYSFSLTVTVFSECAILPFRRHATVGILTYYGSKSGFSVFGNVGVSTYILKTRNNSTAVSHLRSCW
jgi:hypothetical protein